MKKRKKLRWYTIKARAVSGRWSYVIEQHSRGFSVMSFFDASYHGPIDSSSPNHMFKTKCAAIAACERHNRERRGK